MKQLSQDKMGLIDWVNLELERGEYDDFFSHLGNIEGKKVLDVGCGPVVLLEALVQGQSPNLAVALDIDAEWLNYAKQKFGKDRDIVCLRASAEYLPFDNSSFDIIICTAVIPYVWNDTKVIQDLCNCLSEGGILFLRLHSIGNSICRIFTRGRGPIIHNTLSLLSSLVHQLTGKKFFLPSPDTHQSLSKIKRTLKAQNMEIMAIYQSKKWLFMHRLFDVVAKKRERLR